MVRLSGTAVTVAKSKAKSTAGKILMKKWKKKISSFFFMLFMLSLLKKTSKHNHIYTERRK